MKKIEALCLGIFLCSTAITVAQPGDMPTDAEPGKCYAKCLIADQYENVTETVVVRPASMRTETVPAKYETVTERVMVKEASNKIVPVPAKYETVTERVLVKEASTRIVPIAARYETVTEQVVVKEASSVIESVPARYEAVSEEVMVKEASSTIETVPARYEIQQETIEISPATTQWVKKKADPSCLSADPEDCLVWCLVEVPAKYQTVEKRIRVGCPDGYEDNGDDCTKEQPVPAEYGNRTYRKLISPASTRVVEIPAEYKERKYQKLASAATTKVEEIPARYEEREVRKLVSPASTKVVEIPAEYTERTYRKLVTPAAIKTIDIPAETKTVTTRKLVKKGGFSEWREVVCAADITDELVRKVQVALRDMGFDPGPNDNIFGVRTKAALRKFQQSKNLPIGSLDVETLDALQVKY
ncbi:MAG: peptidoglycan-binding protein [Saprospiraceae bacterium]|nr:peptidoglycan-binding protein [Saprospiraceae bacterium]